jgi:predicted Zn-dependent protease with MMP-like domain
MIKKIQNETGARVQFQQGRDDGPGERRCLLTGKPSQVDQARRRIEELIDSVLVSVLLYYNHVVLRNISHFYGITHNQLEVECAVVYMLPVGNVVKHSDCI